MSEAEDPIKARHSAPGPKRMLALDGGGVRGILSLGYLKHIESLLRQRSGSESLVLSDYFDFIGGTSTGAIIAAFLATGNTVDKVIELYNELAGNVFKQRFWRRGIFNAKFRPTALNEALKAQFKNITFSDPEIKTGLMVMAKRWDTGSSWVLHNIRGSRYYDTYTKDYLVRRIVRASAAAPSYFKPELVEHKPGEFGAFVDGGVTPHNNPALQLLMLARMRGFGLNWKLGSGELMIVSVGTGTRVEKKNARSWMNKLPATNALTSLAMLMDDADALNRTLLQWLSNSPTAEVIDKEIGDLSGETLSGENQLHYLRYNVLLNSITLRAVGLEIDDKQARQLTKMDDAGNIDLLKSIGEKAAQAQVKDAHFPAAFDI